MWTGAAYLRRRPTILQWLATAPAVFMTVVTTEYILSEPFAFGLPVTAAPRGRPRRGSAAWPPR